MNKVWFKNSKFLSLKIEKYKSISDTSLVASIRIADTNLLHKFVDRIKQIPADGEKMKSFAEDAEQIDLIFSCETGETERIQIIQKRFKTPSTGFNTSPNKFESELYADIDSLLFPELDKKMLKIPGLSLKFKSFTFVFVGTKEREQRPGEPTIGSISANTFTLKPDGQQELLLRVTDGQIAPQPLRFSVNSESFILLTYETKKKDRLYPDYFQISK